MAHRVCAQDSYLRQAGRSSLSGLPRLSHLHVLKMPTWTRLNNYLNPIRTTKVFQNLSQVLILV